MAAKTDFWGACFCEFTGFVLAGVWLWFFSPKSRASFMGLLRPAWRKDFGWIMGLSVASEILTLIGNLATNLARLLAPVALVLLVNSFHKYFVSGSMCISRSLTLPYP